MKQKIETGGPAFPVSTAEASEGHQDGPNTWQFPGMTLRDCFAAHAPVWQERGARHAGGVEADPKWTGGMRINGRSVAALIEDAEWVKVVT